jgi:hypothetical protein
MDRPNYSKFLLKVKICTMCVDKSSSKRIKSDTSKVQDNELEIQDAVALPNKETRQEDDLLDFRTLEEGLEEIEAPDE